MVVPALLPGGKSDVNWVTGTCALSVPDSEAKANRAKIKARQN
jgi:hypothetical protein